MLGIHLRDSMFAARMVCLRVERVKQIRALLGWRYSIRRQCVLV
jgi:hypothetical protein